MSVKRGRPTKNESEKATHVIAIRVSEDEYARLKEASERWKMPVSKLFKSCVWSIISQLFNGHFSGQKWAMAKNFWAFAFFGCF